MMEQNTTKLSGSSILKTLLRFAGPFLIANLLQTAYSAADMIIVGLYSADVSDISAISNASHVINVLLYTISSFAAGGTVLIGQLAGAGRDGEIRKSVGSIMLFFLYVGLAVSILTYALAQQLVSLMKIPVEAEAASVSYLRICGAGMLFSTGYHVFAAVMRGLGDSRGPMIFIGFTCCVNVVLDFLFVARLHLGVTGTAYATVIAQALSVLFSAVQLRLKHQRLFTPRTPAISPWIPA